MDTSMNLNHKDLAENEPKSVETAGTIAAQPKLFKSADADEKVAKNDSGKLFTQTPETAGVVASLNSTSTSSQASSGGGSMSALA